MLHIPRFVEIAIRIALAGVCCLAIWSSLQFARADYLFKMDNEESIRSAIRLVPDGWEYYMRLAQIDRDHARELLETSLRLDRYNAQANIELGLQYEAEGDYDRAEKQLLAAFDVDHTYLPRWSLANFYLRRGNMPAFWAWARRAAEMPSGDIGPLFDLCWRVSPDAEKIAAAVLNQKPESTRQYLNFLLGKNQAPTVALVAARLVRSDAPKSDLPVLLSAVDQLIADNDATSATGLWHMLIEQHWVTAETSMPNNPEFAREPLPVKFDWSVSEFPGLHSWPGPSGLETEFGGSEPEDCIVTEQTIYLKPGNYTLAYSYHTADIPPDTGIHWQIVDAKSNAILAESPDLSSDAVKQAAVVFSAPSGSSLLRLRLAYRRALGTPRISGALVVLSTQVKALPQP
jgi:tetratricopeptide (TPR) repeat protein